MSAQIRFIVLVMVCALLAGGAGAAGNSAPGNEAKTAIISQVLAAIRQHYALPERRDTMANDLQQRFAAHGDDDQSPTDFAGWVSDVLRDVSNDRHLRLQYNPERYRALSRTPDVAEADSEERYWAQQALANHFGIDEIRQLDGNIAYLKLSSFWIGDEARASLNAALTLIRHDDAFIFDLRANKGGESESVRYLISVLLNDGKPRLLDTIYNGMTGHVEREFSSSESMGSYFARKPLFVLIGPRTYSAGEAFAQHVRNFGLGTLVGQTTAGAGHTVELLPIDEGFVLTLSTGRTEHALTGQSWEGVGVRPDVETAVDEAFPVAQQLARKQLKRKVD